MMDTISKIIGLLLAFALLIIAPLTINDMIADSSAKRIALNETEAFLDKVTDKASISAYDINDLLLGVNSGGVAFDVKIYRYSSLIYKDAAGIIQNIFLMTDDDINSLSGNNQVDLISGDSVQVRVQAIGYTNGQSMLSQLLNIADEPYSFTLAACVR